MIEIRIEAKIAAKTIDNRASLENIRQVDNCMWLVSLPPTVESGLEINAHLPISADDQLLFGTHLPTSTDWL